MPGSVISPADGTIVYSGDCPPGRYIAEPGKKVSVFMSIFDVHVNRAPVSGKVLSVQSPMLNRLIRMSVQVGKNRITSYNVCYTKLLRYTEIANTAHIRLPYVD